MGTTTRESERESVAGLWPLAARGASGLVSPGGRQMFDRAVEGAGIDEGSRVVELGPGVGVTTGRLLERGVRTWTGVDDDPAVAEHLKRTARRPGRRIVTAPLDATGLDAESASVVVADGVLSLLDDAGVAAVLAEGARLLRTSGRLAIIDLAPAADAAPAVVAGLADAGIHVRTAEAWRALAEDAGLAIVGSVTGPATLEPAHEIARRLGPRMTMKLARSATDERVRAAATGARQALEAALPALRAVVVVAERPLILGLRRPR